MKISDKWRVGVWLFLILIFTVSSVALTITLLEWNMQRAQGVLGLSFSYPFTCQTTIQRRIMACGSGKFATLQIWLQIRNIF